MLSAMAKEHAVRQRVRREMQEKRKNETIVAAHALSNSIVEHLNRRVQLAYTNQKRADVEAKRMQNYAGELTKVAEGWISLIDSFNSTLKQVGDVRSWSQAIDADVTLITNTLRQVFENESAVRDDSKKSPAQ